MTQISVNRKAYISTLVLGKAYRFINNAFSDVLLPYNISIPEWKLLGQLSENGNMKLAKLADLLGVEAPLVTALVDSLEKKNLVKRTNDPQDKRAKVIEATKKATRMVEEIDPKIKAAARELLGGVSQEDLNAYIRVLDAIVANNE